MFILASGYEDIGMKNRLYRVCFASALMLCLPAVWAADAAPISLGAGIQVPAHWQVIAHERGDLNGDGRLDTVMVLEEMDAAKMLPNHGLGERIINTNPRHLQVWLADEHGHTKVAENRDWLPSAGSEDAPCLVDPLLEEGGIAIEGGLLKIKLGFWLSCGSYGVARNEYTFRWQQNRLRLIGQDQTQFMRNSGESTEVSINYLTGRKKTVRGANIFEDEAPQNISTHWEKLPAQSAWYLDGPMPAMQ